VPIYPKKDFTFLIMVIVVFAGFIFILVAGLIIFKRKSKKSLANSTSGRSKLPDDIGENISDSHISTSIQKSKNVIKLFGAFKVVNKEGVEITFEFTPKIKSLFLVILLHSTKSRNGITTEELTNIVWPEQTSKNAKNSRGVTIRKLRLILEQIDKVEILFQRDRWTVQLSEDAWCDYFECIDLLEKPQFNSLDYYYNLIQIVEEGQIVKNESYEWMDDIKGYVDYRVIDLLLKYISLLDRERHAQLILKIIDRIHISDPVNEKAFEMKVLILLSQDNDNYARYCHETFSKNFEEFYGQAYQKSFKEIVSLGS
jgi:two-component SAPR family response regulator